MERLALHESKSKLAYYFYKNRPQLIFYYRHLGINEDILKKGYEQLDNLLTYYSKVTVIFLQLHQKCFTKDNNVISTFLSQLKKKLKKAYNCRITYLWVREQDTAPAQHYHLAIMINGHKCCSSKYVYALSKDIWEKQQDGNYSFKVKNRIYRIEKYQNNNELQATRMRMSYLAKGKPKDNRHKYLNQFGTSRLTPNIIKN